MLVSPQAVLSITQSFDAILAVMSLQLLLLLAWAIGCVWHFAGEFDHCSTSNTARSRSVCSGIILNSEIMAPFALGVAVPIVWVNPRYNFDNLQSGLMSMYRVLNRNGWGSIVSACTWATPNDGIPPHKPMLEKSLPLLAFMVVCEMILAQTFVSILINSSTESLSTRSHDLSLTTPQICFPSMPEISFL